MKFLTEAQIESNKAKYQAMVGKQVTVVVTGATVLGTVKEFKEDKYSFVLVVEHEPVNWGGDIYTTAHQSARKCDDWGSLNNTKVVSAYEVECIKELRERGMRDLNGPQAVAIIEPVHGPENFYKDGEVSHKEALRLWKSWLTKLGLYSHQVTEAERVIFG